MQRWTKKLRKVLRVKRSERSRLEHLTSCADCGEMLTNMVIARQDDGVRRGFCCWKCHLAWCLKTRNNPADQGNRGKATRRQGKRKRIRR